MCTTAIDSFLCTNAIFNFLMSNFLTHQSKTLNFVTFVSTKILPKEEKEVRSSLSFRDYQKQGYFQLIKVIKAISLQA